MTEEEHRPNWRVLAIGLLLALIEVALILFVFYAVLYWIRL